MRFALYVPVSTCAGQDPGIQVLTALEGRGWLNAAMVSALVGIRPARTTYIYMRRLERWGLVHRRKHLGRMILYAISQRGHEHLMWLREHSQ